MSEPIPQPVNLSPDQLEQLAIQVARYLPSYLLYRDPPVVPTGSVVPPEGAVVASEPVSEILSVTTVSGVSAETIL